MVAAALSLASTGLALRQQQRANVRRAQRGHMVVRAQATAAPAVEFKGEIKDKTAELAINGARWAAAMRRGASSPGRPTPPPPLPEGSARTRRAHMLPDCCRCDPLAPCLSACCCSHPLPGH